jgi:zinc protease
VERLNEELVTTSELNKAVKQFVAATLATRKTMQGQAQELGSNWISATDLNFSKRFLEAVKRTTPEVLRRVARQYLTAANRTTYALLPTGSTPKTLSVSEVARHTPIQKFELENGLRLLVKEDRRLPFIELRAVLRGGVLAESADTNGVTQLTAKMLLKGTGRRSAEAIALEAESIGGSIDSYGGNNSVGVNAEVMEGDLETGLDLLADVLLDPAFDPALLERERETQLASIRAQRDHLLQSTFQSMRRELFGERGYGLDPAGSESAVSALSVDGLRCFHRRLFVPGNCVLAVYGNIDAEEARRMVSYKLGAWPAGPVMQVPEFNPEPIKGVRRITDLRDKKQAVIVIGYRGATLFSPDRYALELVQEACSDLGSRLFLRIREELGLAYYVGAQNVAGLTPGCFAFYAGTAPESAELVEQELLAQAATLAREGLAPDELARAKAKVVGQRKIARQDLGHLAMSTALDELHGLGYANSDNEDARYEAVTVEQTRTAAQKYLAGTEYVVSIIKPA